MKEDKQIEIDTSGMEEPVTCECCSKIVELNELNDCDSCGRMICNECMWGDGICRRHYEE